MSLHTRQMVFEGQIITFSFTLAGEVTKLCWSQGKQLINEACLKGRATAVFKPIARHQHDLVLKAEFINSVE